jgi:o-succinylbenzoate synthase
MSYSFEIEEKQLEFMFPAKTSRNTLQSRRIFILKLHDLEKARTGWGEASPLPGLSIDDVPDYKEQLHKILEDFTEHGKISQIDLWAFPSIRFALETALADLNQPGEFTLFDTSFSRCERSIPINGLVWMADAENMYEQAIQKLQAGFNCIKFKVGALDFDAECRLLEKVRKLSNAFQLEIRLDANGAFTPDTAKQQLRELKRFEIHSIEQPLKPRLLDLTAELCAEQIIPIALDEELIALNPEVHGEKLLKQVRPQYLILKPGLIGGFQVADRWIQVCRKWDCQWWATSALEGNIGLNAIAQWVSQYPLKLHQGLGTGALFKKNYELGLEISSGQMQRKFRAESLVK